jgi:predicted nucleic acid-binding Zn ribbon protein
VGEFVAGHAQPLRERAGVLTVYCPESVWAQEVALMAPEYVTAINRERGQESVREIRTTATPR